MDKPAILVIVASALALVGCTTGSSDETFNPPDVTVDLGPLTPDDGPPSTGVDGGSASPGKDQFGVTELYPSKEGGENWYLVLDPNKDPRAGVGEGPKSTFTKN